MINKRSIHAILITQATPTDAEDIALIHHTAWQESYKGIIDQSYLDALRYNNFLTRRRKMLDNSIPNSIHLVAKCLKSVGFCDAGASRTSGYKGEIYAIYVDSAFKELGIGTLLMQKASEQLMRNDLLPFIVWVLADNTLARGFYEKLGGVATQEKIEKIGGRAYIEMAYLFNKHILF